MKEEYAGAPVGFSVVCPAFIADAGMYARGVEETGARASALLGTSAPEKVGEAVIDAIRRGRPEVIVSSRPLRPLLALGAISPRLLERAVARAGLMVIWRKFAKGRGRL